MGLNWKYESNLDPIIIDMLAGLPYLHLNERSVSAYVYQPIGSMTEDNIDRLNSELTLTVDL